MKSKTHATPMTCSYAEVLRMKRDNFGKKFSINVFVEEGNVVLWQMRDDNNGQEFEIPRKVFNRLIRWYLNPQPLKVKK